MDGRWLFKDSHIPIVWPEDPFLSFGEILDGIEAYEESRDQDKIDMENLVRHVWEYRRRNAEILDRLRAAMNRIQDEMGWGTED